MKKKLLLLVIVSTILLSAGLVLAQDGFYVIAGSGKAGTQINSVPYIITSPGLYCLAQNLTYSPTSGNAITVNSSDVTLDLMGYCLTGPGNSSGSNEGIRIQNGSSNVEVRNGSIKSFGDTGIYAETCTGVRVIVVRVRDTGATGIWLSGNDHVVAGCSVMNAGAFGIAANSGRWGLSARGCGCHRPRRSGIRHRRGSDIGEDGSDHLGGRRNRILGSGQPYCCHIGSRYLWSCLQ